jgi:flagellar biosynthesis/type III secretory pathway protein FliH
MMMKSTMALSDMVWGLGLTFAVIFTYAWVQNADDDAMKVELARAKQQGYHAGYNKGSSAGLVAAHKACVNKMHISLNNCDWILSSAMVAYADEVQ